jgi:predicted MFS family arabinose efflux permease
MKLFESIPSRAVIFVGMVLQCFALAMFTMSTEYDWQMFARFLSGYSQVILSIYLPVWVDAFAPKKNKTKWMTYIITAAPAGLFLGYTMTAVIVMFQIQWQWAFYIHIILLIPMIQVFFAIKEKYLNVH